MDGIIQNEYSPHVSQEHRKTKYTDNRSHPSPPTEKSAELLDEMFVTQ
jgi:hypothetical protein